MQRKTLEFPEKEAVQGVTSTEKPMSENAFAAASDSIWFSLQPSVSK
jgi:hypothetical protein